MVTFIFSTYFTSSVAPPSEENVLGSALWSRMIAITAIFIAVLSPILGAIADRGGHRKLMLFLSTAVCIFATAMTFNVLPYDVATANGGGDHVFKGLLWLAIANVAYELCGVFYNAFLPEIAPKEKIGRISGYGWALGYVGGLICMVIALFVFVQTDEPLFGLLSKEGAEHIRGTNLLVAVWFAVFSIPMFLYVKEKKVDPADLSNQSDGMISGAFKQLASTFQDLKRYKEIVRLLLARLVYNDGLVTIFAFGGIYAKGTFDFSTEEVLYFGIALNVAAGIGAYVFGFFDDKFGGKYTIMVTLIGLSVAAIIAITAPTRLWFWIAGILVGVFAGPNQAASRSLLGRFVPADKENEFFGFFAFSGKATSFLGPLLFGYMALLFNTQRAGISIVLIFFLVGGIILWSLDEKRGIENASVDVSIVG